MMKSTIIAGVEAKYRNITNNPINIPQFEINTTGFPRLQVKIEVLTVDKFSFVEEKGTPFLEISFPRLKWTCWKSKDSLLYTCLTNVEARKSRKFIKSISQLNLQTHELHVSIFVDKLRHQSKSEPSLPFSTIGHDYYFACYLVGAKFAVLDAILYEYKGKVFLDFRNSSGSIRSRGSVNLLSEQKTCLFSDLDNRLYIQNLPSPSNESIMTFHPIVRDISENRSSKIYVILNESDLPMSLQLLQHSSQPYWDKELMNSFISFLHHASDVLSVPS